MLYLNKKSLICFLLLFSAPQTCTMFSVPLTHKFDEKTEKVITDATTALNGAADNINNIATAATALNTTIDACKINENWQKTIDTVGKTLEKVDPELVREAKRVLAQVSAGTFGNEIVKIWDNASNMIALKAVGFTMATAGFAVLYQWLGSLKTGNTPVWVKVFQKAVGSTNSPKSDKRGDDVPTETTQKVVVEDGEDVVDEDVQAAEKKRYLRNFIRGALPPILGTAFALTGLTFILKARQISNFFVNSNTALKATKSE